jgi:hypothetical protein
MAVGLPTKVSYVDGDVFSASDINDTNGTINLIGQTNNFYAGKNKIINGALDINQRNFTSNTANASFNFDRFSQLNSGGTVTVTPQTFTPGAAPVAGYEATNFVRMVTASQSAAGDFAIIRHAIENVRTFANQTVTFSFWAKATSGTPKITVEIDQNFGSAPGSLGVLTTFGTVTLSTSWARYTVTGTVPSISGKTIGAGSFLTLYFWVSAGSTYAARTNSMGVQNNTFDLWGFQLEAGSTATAFQTATGTIQGELAACQRYYYRTTGTGTDSRIATMGASATNSICDFNIAIPVTMRSTITTFDNANLGAYQNLNNTNYSGGTWTILTGIPTAPVIRYTHGSGVFTQGSTVFPAQNSSGTGFIGLGAEL